MKQKKAQKTSRMAILSENDRAYLQGKKSLDYVRKSQFHSVLDQRFNALLKDLELIHKTEYLKAWKSTRAIRYDIYFKEANYFATLFSNVEKGYQSVLRHVSSGKGKRRTHKFWLDHSPLKDKKIDERIFNKDFLFRHIKKEITESDKKLLLKAVDISGILPSKEDEAITIEEIKKRLSGESKIRTNEERIKNVTKHTFQDHRNWEIYSIVKKHQEHNRKILDKKLKKFDTKCMKYLVTPFFHAEKEKI